MTIYYVDPATGSNSNNGLSWGTAWKWLPGNGTALVAGDEVRFAKTALKTTTQTHTRSTSTITLNTTGYTATTLTSATWTAAGVSGVTATTNGISVANGTTVPANTKLGYRAQTFSITARNGLTTGLVAQWAPSGNVGDHFKICLCSDTAGATVIATLTGRVSNNAQGGTSTATHVFEFDNGATAMNLTVNSVAIYSGTSSFVQNSGAAKTFVSNRIIEHTPQQTTADYMRPGSFLVLTSSTQGLTPDAQIGAQLDVYNGTTATLSETIVQGITTTAAVLGHYPPSAQALHEMVPVSFTGASGNPVRLRGGWDTASGLQDGYTNMAPAVGGTLGTLGIFHFSSGGDYIEIERCLSAKIPLVYWAWATGNNTIASLKLTDCATPYLGTATSSTAITLTSFEATRCFFNAMPPVRKLTTTTPTNYANGVGTWLWVDCVAGRSGTTTTDNLILATEFAFTGTSPAKALFYGQSGSLYVADNSPGTVRLENTSAGPSLTLYGCTSTAATTAAAAVVAGSSAVGTTSSGTVTMGSFRSYTTSNLSGRASAQTSAWRFDGSLLATAWSVGAGGAGVPYTFSGSAQFHAGTGFSIDIKGMHSVVCTGSDHGTSTTYPCICFSNCRNVSWVGGNWSMMTVNYSLTITAFPTTVEVTGVEVTGATAAFHFVAPHKWVRLVGCTMICYDGFTLPSPYNATADLALARSSNSGFPLLTADTFGCTISRPGGAPTVSGFNLPSPTGVRSTKHCGVTVASGPATFSNYNSYFYAGDADIFCEPGSLITASVGNMPAQLSIRQASGAIRRSGGGALYRAATTNAYGRKDLTIMGTTPLARIYVPAGKTLAVSGIVYLTTRVRFFRVFVYPTDGFVKKATEHAMDVDTLSPNQEVPFSFTFAPTTSAFLVVGVTIEDTASTTNALRKIDFAVT